MLLRDIICIRRESAFCLRIPRRSSIRFYISLKKPSYSQLLERFVLLPRVSWSAKYVVLRTLHPRLGISIRATSTNSSRQRKHPPGFEGGKRKRLGDNKRKRADGGRWRHAKVTLLWYKLRYRVPEVREVVTKKVEGSAEAVSLDYRGQSFWNPRDVDANPREDALCPSRRVVMLSSVLIGGLLICTNAILY